MTGDDLAQLRQLNETLLARGARAGTFTIESVTSSDSDPRYVLRREGDDWVVEHLTTRIYAGPDVAAAARAMYAAMRDSLTPPGTERDLHPIVVGGLTTYFWGVLGEVFCAAVRWNGNVVGYLWAGAALAENGAGWAYGVISGAEADERRQYWTERLRELWKKGVPSLDAVRSLLGEEAPGRMGTVDRELHRAVSKMDLDERLNPLIAQRRRKMEAAQRARRRL